MKKIFLLLTSICLTLFSMSQTGWKITSGSSSTAIAKLGDQSALVDINLDLKIVYEPAAPNNEMNRSIMINDGNDNELFRFELNNDKGTLNISSSQLKEFFKDRTKLTLYTIAIPKDPKQAALVRVRRMQVCILTKSETSLVPKKIIKHKKKKSKKKLH